MAVVRKPVQGVGENKYHYLNSANSWPKVKYEKTTNNKTNGEEKEKNNNNNNKKNRGHVGNVLVSFC